LDDVTALPMITRGIFQGLVFLHGKGFTHRDIKPDNIRLEHGTNRVVLIDLGLSCIFDDDQIVQRKLEKFTCDDPDGEKTGAFGYISPGLASALWRRIQTRKQNVSRPVGQQPLPLPDVSTLIWQQNDLYAAALSVCDLLLQPTARAYEVLGVLKGVSFPIPSLILRNLASFYDDASKKEPFQKQTMELWEKASGPVDESFNHTLGTMTFLINDSIDSLNYKTASKVLETLKSY